MKRYISMIRGINVGGHRKVDMAGLKQLYTGLGFSSVVTFIQSGNVVFNAGPMEVKQLAQLISGEIAGTYGFSVAVLVLAADELEDAIAKNPFIPGKGKDPASFYLTFLSDIPEPSKLGAIAGNDYSPDEFKCVGRVVYIHCPGGYGRTKLNNTFFESKLKLTATTRNWNTVLELMKLVQKNEMPCLQDGI
ncbi:MAG TPA: DUF1697 domain-containing protein [Paludibacter sp.]|nr:DUF1697 domain-containing protein [Paludibacter sp.]